MIFLIFIIHFFTGEVRAETSKGPSVRIKIGSGNQLEFRGEDFVLADVKGSFSYSGNRKFKLSLERDILHSQLVLAQVSPTKKNPPKKLLGTVLKIHSLAHFFQLENGPSHRGIRGSLKVDCTSTPCTWINELPVEDYLVGVIQSEISPTWKPAAVDAQIIAARSYAYETVQKKRRLYDLESDEKDQMYLGTHVEDYRSGQSVQRTQGLILTAGSSSEPLRAFFHSTCGGKPLLPQEAWGGKLEGYEKRPSCSFCTVSPHYRWRAEFARLQVEGVLKEEMGNQRFLNGYVLEDFVPVSTGHKKEWKSVWKMNEKFHWFVTMAKTLRSRLGGLKLKSSEFLIRKLSPDSFVWEGSGYGHGVGLCQWGAREMAEKGKSYEAILKNYYPNAGIRRAW